MSRVCSLPNVGLHHRVGSVQVDDQVRPQQVTQGLGLHFVVVSLGLLVYPTLSVGCLHVDEVVEGGLLKDNSLSGNINFNQRETYNKLFL